MEKGIDNLVAEYRILLAHRSSKGRRSLEQMLVLEADWTPRAAQHLMKLARDYGSFMLRNALAIAVALGIEDGDIGF